MTNGGQEVLGDSLDPAHPCFDCSARDLVVCRVLAPEELRRFRRAGSTVSISGGETLFYKGGGADCVYNVTSGLLRLTKFMSDGRRQITGFAFPGDFLGITTERDHAVTAEAVVLSQICRFPRARFDQLLEEYPKVERRLYAMAAHELAAARDQLVLLGRKNAAQKLASFIVMLAERGAGRASAGTLVALPMSRSDIADYLGLRIETVSRELTALKTSRLIQLTGTHEVRILDAEALRARADG